MKRILAGVFLLFSLLHFTGCAGIAKYDSGVIHPFKACALDAEGIGTIVYYAFAGTPDDVARDPMAFVLSPVCLPFFVLDIPISLIHDLITFPYDLFHAGEKIRKHHHEEKSQDEEKKETPEGEPTNEEQEERPK
jgi:hypothetical protein